jgi:transposase InsO family protein
LGATCRRRWLLVVRDPASGYQLAWLAVPDEAAATAAAAALEALLREHGPPLVRKSDNTSASLAEALGALLAGW